ncbi:MAG: NAD-dependent epimerase/dehydratase family protein [Firmicutes bacterium]|nr:NAD-dependent epimerase/dehydratase family protein [Bacillota bacterium]
MKKAYIVTGATGFIGSTIVKKLLLNNEDVVLFCQSEKKFNEVYSNSNHDIKNVVFGCVTDIEKVEKLFDFFSEEREFVVIHSAAIVYLGENRKKVARMREINIEGTRNIIEVCKNKKARLVYLSSVHALPEPERIEIKESNHFCEKAVPGAYSKTKALSTKMIFEAVKNNGLDAVIVHPSGVIGPNDPSNTQTTYMARNFMAGRINIGINKGYDFVDVRDVADAVISATQNGKTGENYFLTSGFFTTREVLNFMAKACEKKEIKRQVPYWLAVFSLPLLSAWFKVRKKDPLFSYDQLRIMKKDIRFSNLKAKEHLGFNPRNVEESLTDLINDLKQKGVKIK